MSSSTKGKWSLIQYHICFFLGSIKGVSATSSHKWSPWAAAPFPPKKRGTVGPCGAHAENLPLPNPRLGRHWQGECPVIVVLRQLRDIAGPDTCSYARPFPPKLGDFVHPRGPTPFYPGLVGPAVPHMRVAVDPGHARHGTLPDPPVGAHRATCSWSLVPEESMGSG